MNIFYVDCDPKKAARALCDRHVCKMVLETAQILCTAAAALGQTPPYKPTHKEHPVVKWAGYSRHNFIWALTHGMELAQEYQNRYQRTHSSSRILEQASAWVLLPPDVGPTPPAQAMPEKYRGDDPVEAYRRYYIGEKASFATWRRPSSPPLWWPEET